MDDNDSTSNLEERLQRLGIDNPEFIELIKELNGTPSPVVRKPDEWEPSKIDRTFDNIINKTKSCAESNGSRPPQTTA